MSTARRRGRAAPPGGTAVRVTTEPSSETSDPPTASGSRCDATGRVDATATDRSRGRDLGMPTRRRLASSATIAERPSPNPIGSFPWPSSPRARCRAPRSSSSAAKHTFFSWSAQGAATASHRDRPCRGCLPLHARGPTDPRLQQPADVRQHRPRRPSRDRRDHGVGDEAAVCRKGLRHGAPGAARQEARGDPPRRSRQGLPHARRRRGDRERDQARPRSSRVATRFSLATAPITA